jgi:hypothetical protein
VAERLAEVEARRSSLSPLSVVEMAVVANLLALGTVQLAEGAARQQLPLPLDAMLGARALHEWARAVRAQHGTGE